MITYGSLYNGHVYLWEMASISSLLTYPIKSTQGVSHDSVIVDQFGLHYDRQWALFDDDNKCMTGREYPSLMDISCEINEDRLNIKHRNQVIFNIPLTTYTAEEEVKLFSYTGYGQAMPPEVNDWFSNYLNTSCRLLQSNLDGKRGVLEKHGGDPAKNPLKFADQAPVLILSEASLEDLNQRLEIPIPINRFRPNIVLKDCLPYEEDDWSIIKIGEVQFQLIQPCERCIFTTIDAITKEKHPTAEPLRTLASYKKGPKGGVVFGMHAIPMNPGSLTTDDIVTIIS